MIADRRSNLLADLDAFFHEHRLFRQRLLWVTSSAYLVAPVVFPSRRTQQHHHSLVIHRQIRPRGGAPSPPPR